MKIIFLEAVQNFGGARKSTVELAKRLKFLGHEVMIVDFWGCNIPFVNEVNTSNLDFRILESRKEPYIIKSTSKIIYIQRTIKYLLLQKKYKREFEKIVEEFQPDVVNVNNLKCLNILNNKASYKIDFFARGWFAYRSLSFLSKKIFKKYHLRFLAVSQSTRQAIYTGGIAALKDIKVFTDVIQDSVYNSYEVKYHKFDANNPIVILHSGGFLHTKGQHICVEVARELRNQNIPFKMIFTGVVYKGESSINYYNTIRGLIKENQLTGFIDIILDPPNILDYFKNMDLLIHPSWTEGLPRVNLEALAFGKPIIANPVGGVTDVVIHNFTGFVADFNEVDQYVNYIKMYLSDKDLYKSHSISARKLIQKNYLEKNQYESINAIYPIEK